jgi:hypothetical protein
MFLTLLVVSVYVNHREERWRKEGGTVWWLRICKRAGGREQAVLYQFIFDDPVDRYNLFSPRMLRILLKKKFLKYLLLFCILVVRGGYTFTTWLFLCKKLIWKIHDDVPDIKYMYSSLKSGERLGLLCCALYWVWWWWWWNGGVKIGGDKSKYLHRIVPQCHFLHYVTHGTWAVVGLNTDLLCCLSKRVAVVLQVTDVK